MKIVVLGTRGIPDIQGGVETHCQELYPRLVKLGCQVTLFTRKKYANNELNQFKGVKLIHLAHPKSKILEAIIHTFLGVVYARFLNPDILHIHAIGPALLVPFAKLLRFKVVVTNHGPDYDRQKWGQLAKEALLLGEKLGTKYADKIIVISTTIKTILQKKYGRPDLALIPNGVNIPQRTVNSDYIRSLGLIKYEYVIAVGRFVPEKGFQDLIYAYSNLSITNIKLVLVGDADHDTDFSRDLKILAKEKGIILTGFIKGEKLNEIFSNARLFVLPSLHEGLPITLLEAMSYNIDILASDIPANLEISLPKENYFNAGNITDLQNKLKEKIYSPITPTDNAYKVSKFFNWDDIAASTLNLYNKITI